MKKYTLLFAALLLTCGTVLAADFDALLTRLDADYTKEIAEFQSDSWLGSTGNQYGSLDVFAAREEFYTLVRDAQGAPEKLAEINAFLAGSLSKNLRNETKVWILTQLAATGTGKEVSAVAPLLDSTDANLVNAAAAALAKIPGSEAQAALQAKGSLPAVKGVLYQRTTANPAWMPNESTMPFALSTAPQADVDAWMAKYDQLDDIQKAQTLAGLTARQDKKYRNVALAALKSESADLRKAGFLALEKLATKDDVDALISYFDTDAGLTIRILGFIEADGFDAALKARWLAEQDNNRWLQMLEALCTRRVDVRREAFAKAAQDDCPSRLAILQQLSKVTTAADTPQWVAALLKFSAGGERDTAENLLAALCNRDATPIIALLGQYSAAEIYPAMCRTGGDAAKAELVKGLASQDAAVKEAAVRGLSVWPDATFSDEMLAVATGSGYSPEQKISALRAYIRVISLPDDKIGIQLSRDQKLEKLQNAFALSTRVDEKKLILSRLAANRTVKSLEFAVKCASDPELSESAYLAIADHAHDNALRQANMEQFLPAMNLVIENSKDQGLVDRVKRYKEQK